jgi:HD superfamily phosphohydrolase
MHDDPEKIVRDAVHGYIHLDAEYCKSIIDTPNFQRLKRLEQTNARPLYPCAHHDRFIHSLGVYHLGRTAFEFIEKNSKEELKMRRLNWDAVKINFEIACLLHDIGHAPFSHTFEGYYDTVEIDRLLITIPAEDRTEERDLFFNDYRGATKQPAPHEKMSALLVLTEYYSTLVGIGGVDPFLIARMILGLEYSDTKKEELCFNNCFINLLNGDTIDVDKLDYYARDQWATGHVSKMLDFERLFSSMYIKKHDNSTKYDLCFHKRAIDDILALIETKKMIAVSMHSHHIVKYDEYILTKAIIEVSNLITKSDNQETIREIISLEALNKSKAHQVGMFKFQLLTDDDLIYILKYYMDQSPYAREWFNRDYRLKAVWKTFADYKYFFKDYDELRREKLFQNRNIIVEKFLTENKEFFKKNNIEEKIDALYYIVQPKATEYNPILDPEIKIFIKEKIVDLKILRDRYDEPKTSKNNDNDYERRNEKEKKESYFLLYLPKILLSTKGKREEFIDFVNEEMKSLCPSQPEL